MASYQNRKYEGLYFSQAYQNSGALKLTDAENIIENCTFNDNGGRYFSTYGGAIATFEEGVESVSISNSTFSNNYAQHGGAIAASQTLNLTNVTFSNNHAEPYSYAGYGGAIFIQGCKELNYTVTSGNSISNQGNYAAIGGFLYDHQGESVFTFEVQNNASLIIGSVSTSTDSINLHKGSKLIKTGDGIMTVNSVLERRHLYTDEGTCTDGDITVEAGTLELNRGGSFDGTVKISGGQLKLGADYTFNSVEFELKTASATAMVSDWRKLSASTLTIDVADAAAGTYILAGNAATFDRNITITDNNVTQTIGKGQSVTIDGTVYSLNVANNNLTLTANGGSEAGSLVVTTAEDIVDANDGVTSLREAITYAATLEGEQTISFKIADSDTVILDDTLNINSSVVIDGTNISTENKVTLRVGTTYAEASQNNSSASNYVLLNVSGESFSLNNLTLMGGSKNVLDISEDTLNFFSDHLIVKDSSGQIDSYAAKAEINNFYSLNNVYGLCFGKNSTVRNSTFDGSLIHGSDEINGGLIGTRDGYTTTVINSTLLNNDVSHSGSAIYIGSGAVTNLINCTVENARGYLGYGNALCSVLGGRFNLLNTIVVTPDGWRTPDIGAAFGSSNTIKYSVYGTTSYSNTASNSYSGYDSEDLFVTIGQTSDNGGETPTLTLRADATVLNNAVLAAVDTETQTLYYSTDNGNSWKRYSDDSDATVNTDWIIDTDQNGISRLTNNKIGASIVASGETPEPPAPVDPSFENNHSFETAYFLGTDSDIAAAENAALNESNEQDYYSFTLTQRSVVTLTTSGNNGGDTQLYLYNSAQEQIAYNDDGNGYFSKISDQTLAAGTYYVMVKAYSSGTVSNYNLTTDVVIPEAGSLVVTTGEDVVDANDGVTSLREALAYAAQLGGTQTVTFDDSVTSAASDSELQIRSSVIVAGNENGSTILESDGGNHTILYNDTNCDSTIRNLTFKNGRRTDFGALYNHGTLLVDHCTFADNSSYWGAAVHSGNYGHAVMTIQNSSFTSNTASSYGGAIDNDGGQMQIENCVFSGNSSTVGGAVNNRSSRSMTIKDSSFLTSSDSIYNNGSLTLQGTISLAANLYSSNVVNAEDAAIDYLLSSYDAANTTVIVSDLAKISGASYSVSVKADQTLGTYQLAGNAAEFSAALSLTVGENTYADVLSIGSTYTVGNRDYTLALNDNSVLTLNIAEAAVSPLVVTTGADVVDANDGVVSLREALAAAAGDSSLKKDGKYTITFDDSIFTDDSVTITLNSTLEIGESVFTEEYGELVIQGTEGKSVILDGNNYSVGIMKICAGNTVSISNLTYQHGYTAAERYSGALWNEGVLSLDHVVFRNNYLNFYTNNDTFIYNSRFEDNSAPTYNYGGAALFQGGGEGHRVLCVNTLFSGNRANEGGAFTNQSATTIVNCTFYDNTASSYCDAIQQWGEELVVVNSTFAENGSSAIYQIWNNNNVYLVNNIFVDNQLRTNPQVNVNALTDASAADTFAELDENGKAVLNEDGTVHIKAGGAADGTGVYVWHNEDYSAIAYSETYSGEKIAVIGDVADATLLSTDQLGQTRSTVSTDIGAVLAEQASIVVTTGQNIINPDDGLTSFAEAVAFAKELGGEQTITFNIEGGDTIDCDNDLTVTADITVDGANAATGNQVRNQKSIVVAAGATLKNYTVFCASSGKVPGDIWMEVGSTGENLTSGEYGQLYATGCTIKDAYIEAQGEIMTYNSLVRNLTIDYQGVMIYSTGNTFTGTLTIGGAVGKKVGALYQGGLFSRPLVADNFTGNASQVNNDTDIVFNLQNWIPGTQTAVFSGDTAQSAMSTNPSMLIDNMKVFTGAGSYTVSVKADQTLGTYQLAGNAAEFDSALSLTVGENTYADVLKVGSKYTVGNRDYTLALNDDSVLTLNIAESPDQTVISSRIVVNSGEEYTILPGALYSVAESSGSGGALYNAGTVTGGGLSAEDRTVFSGNSATSWQAGGAIHNIGNMSLSHIAVIDNHANGSVSYGGGVLSAKSLTLDDAVFEGNTAAIGGGAVHTNDQSGNCFVSITNSVFSDNHACYGGAVNCDGAGVTMSLENVLFDSNVCISSGRWKGCGAAINICNDSHMTLANATFRNNTAAVHGGAIYNSAALTMSEIYCKTATDTIYNTGTITASGVISLAGNFYTGGTVTFNDADFVFDFTSYDAVNEIEIISNMSNIAGNVDWSVTVNADQTLGTYQLAGNAAEFSSALSLTVGENTYADVLSIGSTYTVGGRDYTLALNDDSVLTLNIAEAAASPLVVTTALDVVDATDGVTSLREALAAAASDSSLKKDGKYTITFDDSIFTDDSSVTITLNSTLEIGASIFTEEYGELVIQGTEGKSVILDGNNAVQIMEIGTTNTVTVDTLNFVNGLALDEGGGAIKSSGTLIVENSDFSNNTAKGITYSGRCNGGAIYSPVGYLTIRNSVFTGNTTKTGGSISSSGGGAVNTDQAVGFFIEDSVFEGNSSDSDGGGAIAGQHGIIKNTLFKNNSTKHWGGVCRGSYFTVDGCTFYANTANGSYLSGSGAIAAEDGTVVINSTFVGNQSSDSIDAGGHDAVFINSIVSGGNLSQGTQINVITNSDAAAVDIFAEIDENGKAILNEDGTIHLKVGGAADGTGVYVWHNEDYSAIAYSETYSGNKTAVIGDVAEATILSTDQLGQIRSMAGTDIGAVLTEGAPGTDPADPDDEIAEASALTASVSGAIGDKQDVDLYSFTVSADEKISLQTAADGDSLTVDTYLRLFDAQGNELAADDDSGVNHYSRLGYTFREDGTYYIGVSYYTNTNYDVLTGGNDRDGKTGSYQLTLTRNGYDDPDDQISEAAALAEETTVSGKIAYASDVDMYRITVAENAVCSFTIQAAAGIAPYVRLFDEQGKALLGVTADSHTTELEYVFQSAGNYYLGISGESNRRYQAVSGAGDTETSATGTYSVSWKNVACVYDDPDDTLAAANAAENTAVLTGALEAPTDVDLYKFTVSANEELTFTLSGVAGGTDFDSYIRLFNADGTELIFNDDSESSSWSGMTYRFTEAGTVYLGISAHDNTDYNAVTGEGDVNSATGDYTLTVRSRMTQTVFLSSATDLGTVTTSGPVVSDASIDRPNQVNMYSFEVSAGDTVWVNLDNLAGSNLDSYFRLFDADGTQLAANDDGAAAGESAKTCESYMEYTFANAGKYYLGVSSYGNQDYEVSTNALIQSGNSSGSYRLAFGLVVEDTDSDDTLESAAVLTAGTAISAALDTATDVDMYKITLARGETLTASISLQGLQDSYLRLFDANGIELAANDDGGFKTRANAHASRIVWQAQTSGTYYLGVSGYGNVLYKPVDGSGDKESRYTGNYSITASIEASRDIIADDEYEDNDSLTAAAALGTVSGTRTVTGLTMNDEADWYTFTISKDTGVESRISLVTADSDAALSLNVYQADGTLIGYATDGTLGVSLADLCAGDYYFKVAGDESDDYSISMNITEAAAAAPAGVAENYVVLFSGGYDAENNRTYYYDSIKNMYGIATETYGVDADHIYILYADGTDTAADNAQGENSDMSYASGSAVLAATESNLRRVFQEISVSADSNDHFIFYSFDHGSEALDGTDYLCGWNEMIQDKDFAVYAEEIGAGYQTYLMAQCYSGGIIEDLTIRTNMFAASASDAQSPSTTLIYSSSDTVVGGFSKSVEDALAEGINSTYALYQEMLKTNPSVQKDNPQSIGSDFNIFATGTAENNAVSSCQNGSTSLTSSGSAGSINYVVNKNGNYAPVITGFSIYDDDVYNTVSQAEIGDTVALTVKAFDPDAEDEIAKMEFYCTGSDGKRQLIAVDNDSSDGWQYLWTLGSDCTAGYYSIAALAQDSFGNYSSFSDVDFRILEKNYHPEITSISLDSDSYYIGQSITVSGVAQDADSNGIDSVRIYLDTDKDGKASYPDEYLGLARVSRDGSWSYTLALNSGFDTGSYMIFAEAVDSLDMLTGEAAGVSFMVSSPTVSDLEITVDSIQWKKTSTDACVIEYSQDKFQTALAIETSNPAVDVINLTNGEYQVRAKYDTMDMWNETQTVSAGEKAEEPAEFVSNADGIGDLFFAAGHDTWMARYNAQHVGSVNDWSGTQERVSLAGKNKITDVFEGSSDANILLLTDDANGDALFVDDIYSAFPDEQQARIAQIDEIRAGGGDDIVDMTSQQFEYIGDGLTIRGGMGNDTLWANKGNNMLFGDAGNDRLVGASGNDVLAGGTGNDSMHGGGGSDTFCFCSDWGEDTVEQLADGTVTLWFAEGDNSHWNAAAMTYSDGQNTVTVTGITADKVTLKFGDDSSAEFDILTDAGAFLDASSEKIFEEKDKGVLASL